MSVIEMNQMGRIVRRVALLASVVASLALSACAHLQATPEEAVRKLSEQRWSYLLAGKYEKAYEMSVPSYRKIRTLDFYAGNIRSLPVRWKKAEITNVVCEPAKCRVTINLTYKLFMFTQFKGDISSGQDETWILEDGQWWMFESL